MNWGTDVFAEPTHPSPSPGFSSRFLHLVLIRTVCRHSLAKVSACPRAAACWGNRTGGTTMAKILDGFDRGHESAHLHTLTERSALSIGVGGS
jgi:hypothetical protein